VLKNITEREIHHLRRQLQIADLIGTTSTNDLAQALASLGRQAAEPYERGLRVGLVDILKATPARHLKLDPAGYFVIMVMKDNELPLLVEHYSNDGKLKNMMAGEDAASICAMLIEKKLVSRLDHAAYLGRELAKAEQSLTSGLKYKQDKAQGQLVDPSINWET
jgi:tetrahydromethanopterin S-methyltransferase subunit A